MLKYAAKFQVTAERIKRRTTYTLGSGKEVVGQPGDWLLSYSPELRRDGRPVKWFEMDENFDAMYEEIASPKIVVKKAKVHSKPTSRKSILRR